MPLYRDGSIRPDNPLATLAVRARYARAVAAHRTAAVAAHIIHHEPRPPPQCAPTILFPARHPSFLAMPIQGIRWRGERLGHFFIGYGMMAYIQAIIPARRSCGRPFVASHVRRLRAAAPPPTPLCPLATRGGSRYSLRLYPLFAHRFLMPLALCAVLGWGWGPPSPACGCAAGACRSPLRTRRLVDVLARRPLARKSSWFGLVGARLAGRAVRASLARCPCRAPGPGVLPGPPFAPSLRSGRAVAGYARVFFRLPRGVA